jgi:hypothetical protein
LENGEWKESNTKINVITNKAQSENRDMWRKFRYRLLYAKLLVSSFDPVITV